MNTFPFLQNLVQPLRNFGFFEWTVFSVILLLGLLLVLYLKKTFFRQFCSFFAKNAFFDEAVEKKLSTYALCLAILLPCFMLGACIWLKLVTNHGVISGRQFGTGTSLLILLLQLSFLLCTFKLLSLFNRCYKKREKNTQRPIRAMIIFFYIILFIMGIICITSILAKERPVMVLSTFGAAAALFVFAFQNLISSMVANVQINAENIVKVGDWVVIESKGIDGIVEMISTNTIRIRNWDMSLVFLPTRLLTEQVLVNYNAMIEYGARQIKRSLYIDQRSVRFLSADEVEQLKTMKLVDDDLLKRSDSFGETEQLAGTHFWTNIELFNLYAEDYLRRRPDIRHDMKCLVRSKAPSSQGIPLELFCYSTRTTLMEFEPVQRAIFYHLLAVLPSFRLRVFQDCSDIHQRAGDIPDRIGGIFSSDHLENPIYADKKNS